MTHYTVCCGYASHYHNTVTVEAGTLTTEVTGPPAPSGNKPLATVARRADGAPDVTVSGGRARVLILDPGDTGPPPAG